MKGEQHAMGWQRTMALALPVLYAAYPALSLLANNIEEVSPAKAGRALACSILASVILLLVLRLIVRDWAKASLICTGALLAFFSYGHVYAIAKVWSLGGYVIGRHRYLLPLSLLLLGAWTWFVLRRVKRADTIIGFFGLVGLASLAVPVYTIGGHLFGGTPVAVAPGTASPTLRQAPTGPQPDIYYIILDGYAREDVLRDLYAFDNSEFLGFLEDHGFYVADASGSNYMQTWLSLASSLNMRYLDDVAASVGESSRDVEPIREMVEHSAVRQILSARGYRMVAFENAYNLSTISDADIYLPEVEALPPGLRVWPISAFEALLLESTMARAMFDGRSLLSPSCVESPVEAPYLRHREGVLSIISTLEEIPEWEGDLFVFAHIIAPHPPFVFGPNGEALCHRGAFTLNDGNEFSGSEEEYIAGYQSQLVYLNGMLMHMVTQILRHSDPAPIVILQADHGPGAYMDWSSAERSNIRERLAIFSAYYLPGGDQGLLYDSISPVNSFRVVSNLNFGGDYELLEDESYFSTWNRPFDLIRVTERVDTE